MTKTGKPDNGLSSMTTLLETMQAAAAKSMPAYGTEWVEAMTEMGTEVLNFTAARIKQDVQMQHDLLNAKGPAEIQHIQARFFQKAMDDYAAEAGKLVEMSKSLTPTGATKA